jgi:hypothetical protein
MWDYFYEGSANAWTNQFLHKTDTLQMCACVVYPNMNFAQAYKKCRPLNMENKKEYVTQREGRAQSS